MPSTDDALNSLATCLFENAHFDRLSKEDLGRIRMFKHQHPVSIEPCVYEPSVALIIQGSKRVFHDNQVYEYSAGTFLLTSMDVPVTSEIIDASPEKPYLSMLFKLDMDEVFLILERSPQLVTQQTEQYHPLKICLADLNLIDAFKRLIALHNEPNVQAPLTKLIHSEITIRLLAGPGGQNIKTILHHQSSVSKITTVIDWLKDNYMLSLKVEELAAMVFMNPSTFRQSFKQFTGMSPLQYLKTLRLQNAKKMMLNNEFDASTAAIHVGYESVSQFSREYKRYFGNPPKQDIQALRQ